MNGLDLTFTAAAMIGLLILFGCIAASTYGLFRTDVTVNSTGSSDLSNYYNQTQIDALFIDYYNKTETYSKSEVATYLLTYVNVSYLTSELANYYNVSQVNNQFGSYYNKTEIDQLFINYLNDYYTKTEVDAFVSGMAEPNYYNSTMLTYHSWTTLINDWTILQSQHPDVISNTTLSNNTYLGKTMYAYRIGNPDGAVLMYDGSCHGEESVSSEVLLLYAQWLVNAHSYLSEWTLRNCYTIIVPSANPDSFNTTRKNANGVDLNRNFYLNWSTGSADPANLSYRGSAANSENETVSMINLWLEYLPQVYCNFHTGQVGSSPKQVWYSWNFNEADMTEALQILTEYNNTCTSYGVDAYPSSEDGEYGNYPNNCYYYTGTALSFSAEMIDEWHYTSNASMFPTYLEDWLPLFQIFSFHAVNRSAIQMSDYYNKTEVDDLLVPYEYSNHTHTVPNLALGLTPTYVSGGSNSGLDGSLNSSITDGNYATASGWANRTFTTTGTIATWYIDLTANFVPVLFTCRVGVYSNNTATPCTIQLFVYTSPDASNWNSTIGTYNAYYTCDGGEKIYTVQWYCYSRYIGIRATVSSSGNQIGFMRVYEMKALDLERALS